MADHVSGPWQVQEFKKHPDIKRIIDKNGSFIADADYRQNARLIAAAPELLAALIDAESAMFHVRADGGFATAADRQAMDDAWIAARAAIAKATGQ